MPGRQEPARVRIAWWDRAAITGLGAAGAALSFDALQQMAAAIHVRQELVWLFPLVIDGFIAYGVRALVVLRDTSFAARLYVWTLFAAATATSIWANGLHAVRLNQQSPGQAGLHLGDLTVGVLSTAAPLALAGAVHLYILIARRAATTPTADGYPTTPGRPRTDQPSPWRGWLGTDGPSPRGRGRQGTARRRCLDRPARQRTTSPSPTQAPALHRRHPPGRGPSLGPSRTSRGPSVPTGRTRPPRQAGPRTSPPRPARTPPRSGQGPR